MSTHAPRRGSRSDDFLVRNNNVYTFILAIQPISTQYTLCPHIVEQYTLNDVWICLYLNFNLAVLQQCRDAHLRPLGLHVLRFLHLFAIQWANDFVQSL